VLRFHVAPRRRIRGRVVVVVVQARQGRPRSLGDALRRRVRGALDGDESLQGGGELRARSPLAPRVFPGLEARERVSEVRILFQVRSEIVELVVLGGTAHVAFDPKFAKFIRSGGR
jgi:hypothetical protein